MGSKEFCVFEKASPHIGVTLDVGKTAAHAAAQVLEVVLGRVGQHRGVEVGPEGFDGIEFGGIGREPLNPQPATVLVQGVLREAAAVGREAIPQQQDSTSPMAAEGFEEIHEVGTADASRLKGQEPAETPCVGRAEHEADARQSVPIEGFAQAGRATSGGPGGAHRRAL